MRGTLLKVKTKRKPMRAGDATWRIILSLGRGVDGKYKQKWVTFHGNRRQAEEKLTELTSEVHRGEFVDSSKITVGEWLDHWVEKSIASRCAGNTYLLYRNIVKNHLNPRLGSIRLQHLLPLHVERYYADLKLSPGTVQVHHGLLSNALNAAIDSGLLRQNVAKRVKNRPRVVLSADAVKNCWTKEEARTFINHIKTSCNAQYVALFALALDTGLRKSELLGLQWRDLRDNTLCVERQLETAAKAVRKLKGIPENPSPHLDVSLPKTRKARVLELGNETVSLLREHKRQQAEVKLKNRQEYVDHGLMFAQGWEERAQRNGVLGERLPDGVLGWVLSDLCKACNVKRITPHGLRHTCATLMLSAGVQPHVVQKRLGHSDIGMTLGIYAHVLPSMQTDAASRLAMLLHG